MYFWNLFLPFWNQHTDRRFSLFQDTWWQSSPKEYSNSAKTFILQCTPLFSIFLEYSIKVNITFSYFYFSQLLNEIVTTSPINPQVLWRFIELGSQYAQISFLTENQYLFVVSTFLFIPILASKIQQYFYKNLFNFWLFIYPILQYRSKQQTIFAKTKVPRVLVKGKLPLLFKS